MRFSFVIPVLNGERFIGRCLERVLREGRGEDQVLVLDNGSTDRTVEIARGFPGVIVVHAPGVTIAGLRNRGAAMASNEILAFVDADCLLCPGWRDSAERVLRDSVNAATGSYYDIPEDATWVERAWWSFRPTHEHRTSFLISGNLIIRKTVFDSVGGFNERLVTDEDTDISRRLVSAGAVLIEAPSVRVVHLGNAKTLRGFFGKEKWHATSIVATAKAHSIDRPMFLTLVFMASCALALIVPFVLEDARVIVAMLVLVMIAPGLTAGYKVVKHGTYRYFFQLLVLYLIVYLARSSVLLQLVRPNKRIVPVYT